MTRRPALDAIRQTRVLLDQAAAALATPTIAVEQEPDRARPWWRPRFRWTVAAGCGCTWSGWSWTAGRGGRAGWRAYGHAIAHTHHTQEEQP